MGTTRKPSRRELIRSAARLAPLSSDVARLRRLLELEQLADRLYSLALQSGTLSPAAMTLCLELRSQERSHARALAPFSGRALPEPPGTRLQVERSLARAHLDPRLGERRSERAWFILLERLEHVLEGAYYEALAHLTSPGAATLAAQILASEAQHQTLLFRLRHPDDITLAVSVPLVHGSAPPPM
jgi:hypothetical protein